MDIAIKNLDNVKIGDIKLSSNIFGLSLRPDILNRMVNWQRSRKQSGNHKTRLIHEISGTTKKPWKQKGTGRARAGSLRITQFRGGSTMFGPRVRSHAHKLPKRFRSLALKIALSSKKTEGNLHVFDTLNLESNKTKYFVQKFEKLSLGKSLFIDGETINKNFFQATFNVPNVDVLPQQGINVYDIINHKTLILTKDAIKYLEKRLES